MSEPLKDIPAEKARALLVKLGKEALYYRDEMAQRIMQTLGDADETQRIEAWTELHLQWGMRLRTYAEVAVELGLFHAKEDYAQAIRPERKTEDEQRD